ncbi:MAG: SidJ-related pseudokinase [Desulfobacterales bacterium]
MYTWNLKQERREAENYLLHRQTDFTATYMQVSNLQFIVAKQPETIKPETVSALKSVLFSTTHNSQRQVFFLFKKAADALAAIVRYPTPDKTAAQAGKALAEALSGLSGHSFRAAAEAMGGVPLELQGSGNQGFNSSVFRIRPVKDLATITGTSFPAKMRWKGRSLVIDLDEEPERVLVLKFARPGQSVSDLASEAGWMKYLSGRRLFEKQIFEIPEPQGIKDTIVYRVSASAVNFPKTPDIDPKHHAVAFMTSSDYFAYPNHPKNGKMISKSKCRKILGQSARLLGNLSALGIIHTAPIPLFHNRVQRHRRQDRGLYQWRRGGRLDRWLDSCRHPNISAGGIRDFEHFITFDGPARTLYEYIGTHVLSLILVAGSYCRNHDETRAGMDDCGNPVDARDLFDHDWLKNVLADVFTNYYEGFTGARHSGNPPRDLNLLATRLIEEMGVDRHMEEILRTAEQENMSDKEFRNFLEQRGFGRKTISGLKKGENDISILTGPHLGGFNQRISVPELIEYAAALSALCIMDRYCKQRFIPAGTARDPLRSFEESSAGPPCSTRPALHPV